MGRYSFLLLILLFVSACKKDETEVVTDDPIIGNWRYSGGMAYVDGQAVVADKYSIILYITDSTIKSVTQISGKLANDPQTEIHRITNVLSYYERLPHGVICTIDNYEEDSIAIPGMIGKEQYFVFNFLTLDRMQFMEADECIRVTGTDGSIENSTFYYLDSIRGITDDYSYIHHKCTFAGDKYNEYSATANTRQIPAEENFTLSTSGTVKYSDNIYNLTIGDNQIKVPYFFSGGKLYQKKLNDTYFDNYSWISPK